MENWVKIWQEKAEEYYNEILRLKEIIKIKDGIIEEERLLRKELQLEMEMAGKRCRTLRKMNAVR